METLSPDKFSVQECKTGFIFIKAGLYLIHMWWVILSPLSLLGQDVLGISVVHARSDFCHIEVTFNKSHALVIGNM